MRLELTPELIEALPEAQRAEARELLEELERRLRENPLLRYEPHAKQAIFHASTDRAKCFFGGNRAGKTTAGILDDILQAVDRDVVPDSLQQYKKWEPPFKCRIVNPSFTEQMEGVVFEKLRDWLPKGQLVGDSWDKAYDKQRRQLLFKNGSRFSFMTYEQDRDKFGGAALHRVHYDEEPPEEIREECKYRLIDYRGDELFTMTPTYGMSWMYDTFYDPWERGVSENLTVVVVDMDDNPYIGQEEKEYALAGSSEESRAARKSGKFVSFSGLVYPDFKRGVHVVPEHELPRDRTVVAAIDPGVRHMAAVVWAYVGVDDDLVVFAEATPQGATVERVCRQIKMVEKQYALTNQIYVIDPAARNIMHQTGRSDQMTYADHGVITILGQNDVQAGIDRVRERINPVEGDPKLHIMASCQTLIEEFKRYRWIKQGRGEHESKEAPVKKDDHALDALRYLVMSRPIRPRPTVDMRTMSRAQRALYRDMHQGTPRRRASHAYGVGIYD